MIKPRALGAWILASAFLFYEVLLRILPNILTTPLQMRFSINPSALGVLSATYIAAYALGQLPAGFVIERYGVQRTLPVAACLTTLALAWFAQASAYPMACIARGMMGLGSAYAFMGCLCIIFNNFPAHQHARLIGLTVTIAASAGLVSNSVLTWVLMHANSHTLLLGVVAFGALISLLMVPVLSGLRQTQTLKHPLKWPQLKRVLHHPAIWRIGVIASCLYLPYAMLGDLWGQSFFQVTHHISFIASGWLISSLWAGWMIGSPLITSIPERWISLRTRLLWAAMLETVALALLLYPINNSLLLAVILCAMVGFGASAMNLCYLWSTEKTPASTAANALINTQISVAVLTGLPALGALLDAPANSAMPLTHLLASHYRHVMCLLLPVLLIGWQLTRKTP